MGCSAALAALAMSTAGTARAEVDLQWIAPAECPREEAVRDKMRSLSAASLEQVDRLSAEGEITRVGNRYRLTLRVRIGAEVRERVMESEVCADLAGAAAVTLGLLLSSDAGRSGEAGASGSTSGTDTSRSAPGESKSASTPNGAPTSPAVPPKKPEVEGGEEAAQRSDTEGGAGAELSFLVRGPVAALDVGPLPRPGFDLGAGAGIAYGAWQLVASGRFGPGQRIERSSLVGAGASVRRLAAELSSCRGFGSAAFELAPCLVVALEHVTASGFGSEIVPRTKRAAWVAPGAGLLARVGLGGPLSLVAGVTGYVEVARPHLVIEDVGEVDQLAPVALRAFVGTDWIF